MQGVSLVNRFGQLSLRLVVQVLDLVHLISVKDILVAHLLQESKVCNR